MTYPDFILFPDKNPRNADWMEKYGRVPTNDELNQMTAVEHDVDGCDDPACLYCDGLATMADDG